MTYKEIKSKYEIEVWTLYELEKYIGDDVQSKLGYLDVDRIAEIIDDEYKHLINDHYTSNEDYEKLVDKGQLEEVIWELEH